VCPFCHKDITLALKCCPAFQEFSKLAGYQSYDAQTSDWTEAPSIFARKGAVWEQTKNVAGNIIMNKREGRLGGMMRREGDEKQRRKDKERRRGTDGGTDDSKENINNKVARLERRRAAREGMR